MPDIVFPAKFSRVNAVQVEMLDGNVPMSPLLGSDIELHPNH